MSRRRHGRRGPPSPSSDARRWLALVGGRIAARVRRCDRPGSLGELVAHAEPINGIAGREHWADTLAGRATNFPHASAPITMGGTIGTSSGSACVPVISGIS